MNNNDEWCGKHENTWILIVRDHYIFDFVRDSIMMNFRFV